MIQIHDLYFRPFMTADAIHDRVRELAQAIHRDYAGRRPLFLGILNGAFIFAADLVRYCDLPCEVSFIKLSSYRGLRSGGDVTSLIGLEIDIKDRHIILVEDIVDSGNTMQKLLPDLMALKPASLALAVLLLKPDAMDHPVEIDYLGFEIPPEFVVGYGLDYNGLGRNLPGLYRLSEEGASQAKG